jgi:hypothetical protein
MGARLWGKNKKVLTKYIGDYLEPRNSLRACSVLFSGGIFLVWAQKNFFGKLFRTVVGVISDFLKFSLFWHFTNYQKY